ncbi:MAG: HAD-IA family hydrolase [Marinibacterium sp.]|nr:HAD-IA family hydrolase [Marinibacterium sp.]
MTAPLRLVLFDVDGTLVDSQDSIVTCMGAAFDGQGLPAPDRGAVLSIVGLSLPVAMAQLAPQAPEHVRDALVAGYKQAYHAQRLAQGAAGSPLFPGARAAIDALHAIPEVLLGVATGKSQRGLDGLLQVHGLDRVFATRQVADHHPSKPHPSMILTAMAETGVGPDQTVMIGDTAFDIDMARAAGVTSIGVDWGYHPDAFETADHGIRDFAELMPLLKTMWGIQH